MTGTWYSFLKIAPFVVLLSFLSGCSTSSVDDSSAIYHEAAFNDRNKAPSWMSPPSESVKQPQLDKVYVRSQADYHFSLGETYSLEGNYTKALQEFKHALVYDGQSAILHMRLASEYIKAGLFNEAIEHAQEGVRLDPKSVESRLLLGGLYSSLRMFSEALREYQQVLKSEPGNVEAPLYIGAIYAEKKQFSTAIGYFESLIKQKSYKTPHRAYYYMSQIYKEWKKGNRLVEVNLKKALGLKPDYTEALLSLGKMYTQTQRLGKAKKLYARFQKKYGPKGAVAEELSRLYLEDEEYNLAYEQLEIMDQRSQKGLNTKLKMALILIEKKSYEKAIYKLQEIVSHVPDSDKIRFYLGAVYEETGRHKKAIENYKKIPSVSQFYSEALVHSTYLYKMQGKMDKAIETIERGLKERQDIAQFYTLYASLLDDTKSYKKAVVILKQGVERFPKDAQMRFSQGFIHDKLGNKEIMISSMHKVLELDENHIQGLNYLAYTYAEKGEKLSVAEKLVLRAMSLKPNDGYIMDTYGLILYKRGRLNEAVKVLETAYKSVPEGIVAEHLGDVYHKLQLKVQAQKMYLKAMEIEKDERKVQRIREKLSTIVRQDKELQRSPASISNK